MPDETVDILLRTQGDTSGAQKVAGAVDEATAATRRSVPAHDEAGKAAEKHGGHLHAMHKVFHALNEVVPGLGVLMQAAFSPVGAAIALAVMALRGFHEKMKEVNEEFKRMEEECAKPLTRSLEAQRDAVVEGAVGMEKLRESLEDAARGHVTLDEKTKQTLDTMKRMDDRVRTLAETVKAEAEETLAGQQKRGLISEQDAAEEKLNIQRWYEEQKQQLQEAGLMREILAKQRAVEQAELQQEELAAKAEAAEKARIKAMIKENTLASKDVVEGKHEGAKKALKDFEEGQLGGVLGPFGKFAAFQDSGVTAADTNEQAAAKMHISVGNFKDVYGDLLTQWSKLTVDVAQTEEQWKNYPIDAARFRVATERATHAAERAAKDAEENQGFITTGHRDIGIKRAEFGDVKGGNRDVRQARDDAELERAGFRPGAGRGLMEVVHGEEARAHGQQMSAGQAALVQNMVGHLRQAHASNQQIDGIIRMLMDLHKTHEEKLAALASELSAVRGFTRTNMTNPGVQ